uniref:Uncharacterized protein n=1 Tax=Arundo donax TaxID=35708 RepID=A0A0A9HSG2_ARUDO
MHFMTNASMNSFHITQDTKNPKHNKSIQNMKMRERDITDMNGNAYKVRRK